MKWLRFDCVWLLDICFDTCMSRDHSGTETNPDCKITGFFALKWIFFFCGMILIYNLVLPMNAGIICNSLFMARVWGNTPTVNCFLKLYIYNNYYTLLFLSQFSLAIFSTLLIPAGRVFNTSLLHTIVFMHVEVMSFSWQ